MESEEREKREAKSIKDSANQRPWMGGLGYVSRYDVTRTSRPRKQKSPYELILRGERESKKRQGEGEEERE